MVPSSACFASASSVMPVPRVRLEPLWYWCRGCAACQVAGAVLGFSFSSKGLTYSRRGCGSLCSWGFVKFLHLCGFVSVTFIVIRIRGNFTVSRLPPGRCCRGAAAMLFGFLSLRYDSDRCASNCSGSAAFVALLPFLGCCALDELVRYRSFVHCTFTFARYLFDFVCRRSTLRECTGILN